MTGRTMKCFRSNRRLLYISMTGGLLISVIYLLLRHENIDEVLEYTPESEVLPSANMKDTTDRFHVVLTFPVDQHSLTAIDTDGFSLGYIRMMEYKHCLTKFLNNEFVKQVHALFNSSDMPKFIQDYIGSHPKLNLHKVKSPEMVLTLHQFAFTHLQGEVVAITQADIVFGEGVEMIYKTLLVKHRLMYSLSRHEAPCGTMNNLCKYYIGSHDTFIFVPQGNVNAEAKSALSHTVSSWGTESVINYVYAKFLKYNVLNPCKTIKIHHFHCSSFRPKEGDRIQVNRKNLSAICYPTNRLA